MFNSHFEKLQYIKREPVPEHLWANIQYTIERRRMQAVPIWMKIAAMVVTLMLLAEMIASVQKIDRRTQSDNTTNMFYQNNQWYND
jgi:hypothetical protein